MLLARVARLHKVNNKRISLQAFRAFSSPSPKKDGSENLSIYEKYKPQITQATIVGGVGLTLYGLSSFMWDVAYGLMSMTPIQSAYYGFVTGVTATGVGGATVYYTAQNRSINADRLLRKTIHILNSSQDVRTTMGGSVSHGELSAFRHSPGSWHIASWRPHWAPAKMDMIFNIYSGKNEGIVTVQAIQEGLHSKIQFIGADVLNQHSTRLLVNGNARGFETHDSLKALVSFKSVQK